MKGLLHRSYFCGPSSLVLFGLSLIAAPLLAASYDELRAAAVKGCQTIDPAHYQSGLLLNPDGYRSYYVRSECFQKIAVQFRDEALCAEVKQRHSLFSSSWGYSHTQCRRLIVEGIVADGKALEEIKRHYLRGAVHLRDFRVERNGNGRDFDIVPSFVGDYGHGHTLRFDVTPTGGEKASVLLHSSGYYVDGNSNLRIFIRQEEVIRRFPEFVLGRLYTVRGTIVLDIGNGGPSGWWSDVFIERVFPMRERSQSITREVRF
jgi:hypothetical protein